MAAMMSFFLLHTHGCPSFRRQVGARIRSSSDLRLRIHAHPGAYRAPRALVTIPIRQVRMGAGFVPLQKMKHRTDHHADWRITVSRCGGSGHSSMSGRIPQVFRLAVHVGHSR